MLDIKQFNERFLFELKHAALFDRRAACISFALDPVLVDIVAETSDLNLSRLASNECTLVRQNFCSSILVPSSSGMATTSQLTAIQLLNYEYLMLVRHIAVKNVREAMLRTGVEYAAADRLGKLAACDIQGLVKYGECMIGKCHLTPKAVKTAVSEFSLPSCITMLSMRNRSELCLR